jgi:hypothetical protein
MLVRQFYCVAKRILKRMTLMMAVLLLALARPAQADFVQTNNTISV